MNMAFMSQSDRHCVVSAIKCEVGCKNCHKPLWEGKRIGKMEKGAINLCLHSFGYYIFILPIFFNITFKNHSLYNVDVHNFPLP